ncbi:MAG TPA: ABC transporter transmembrane domain-containing protein [Gaiellales bacterium]|nr:ABC transporter transmembrane domain-containing protein [Gaiellales bacterium]
MTFEPTLEQPVDEEAEATGPPPRWTQWRVILSYFRRDIRKRRGTLVGGACFGALYAAARVAEPWPIKVVFDQVLYHKPAQGWWVPLFTPFGTQPTDILLAAGLLLGLAGLVRGISYYYEDFLLSKAAQEIVYSIRSRLYRHLHRLPISFHQQRRTGDTLVRLSSDIILLRDIVVDSVVNLGTGAIMLMMMLAVMLAVDPLLTAVSLAVMPLITGFTWLYGRRIRENSKKQRKREGEVAAAMHEAISSMAVVQLHGAEQREQERFHDINRRSLKQGIKATRLEAQMNRSVEITIAGGLAVIMTMGTLRALHGAITPGDLIVFVSYLRAAYRPLQRASKTVQRGAKALAAAERVVEILDTEPDLTDAPDAVVASPFRGEITLTGVDFAYANGHRALEKVDLTIPAGSTVAVVGETGSGKSTLLSLLPRLHDPTTGTVCIDGHDLRTLTLDSLRSQVSVVLQDSVLFGLSIADNIRYGQPDATDEEVVAAATAAGIHGFVVALPDGYETVISERGSSLSGGQRQRIALARALVRRSPILLLDEPTASLDEATQEEVIAAVEQLIGRTTTILVTHDMRLAKRADAIIVLDAGRVVARGTDAELSRSCPTYRRLTGALQPVQARRPAPDGTEHRILFYSHNGVGVGHAQRQLDLAGAYKQRHPSASVLVVTGSHAASMFAIPEGVDYLKLPSLVMTDRYRNWAPRDLALPTDAVSAMRASILEETVERFRPGVLVADFMPAGPYGELLPALQALERQGGRAVAGFRDVIDEPDFVRTLWQETNVYDTLRRHYHDICVYGDPAMTDFAEAYGLEGDLAGRVRYCGYLGRTRPDNPVEPPQHPLIVATSGGGVDGAEGLEHFIATAALLAPDLGGSWLAVTGPLMPLADHQRLAELGRRAGVTVERVVPELRRTIAAADCVVAMAGYNTVCDILSFHTPAVLTPRPGPSMEQQIRARRLSEWDVAQVVDAGRGASALAAAIHQALATPPHHVPVGLGGISAALDVFDETETRRLAA